jgi:SagB-type dehydrogenase family enzyme
LADRIELRHRLSPLAGNIERDGDRLTILRPSIEPLSFPAGSSRFADALMQLDGAGATHAELVAIAAQDGDANARDGIDVYLERFCFGQLLEWSITLDGEPLATVASLTSKFGPDETNTPPDTVELSRFAWIRRDDEGLILESSIAPGRITLSARGAALIGALAAPGSDDPDARGLAIALWRFGFFEDTAAEESPARRTWQFHDKLMHESSRHNRDTMAAGEAYKFKDEFPSPPAIKPDMDGAVVPLPAVDEAAVRHSSDSLLEVMSRRQSGYDYGDNTLTLADLSTFLYRVARTTDVIQGPGQELLSRPYPSGGSIHELEFYIAIRQCEGLQPGIYHYQGLTHRLHQLPDSATAAERMITVSARGMGQADNLPDTVISLASRTPRLSWKYNAIAYRLTLLNAGVVHQTMYLVATDMGLQGCANAVGDSRILADVTGLDPFEETSIAEFALSAGAN